MAPRRPRPRALLSRCAAATAAYYRSQLLNTVIPGGVLGDVDRAVRHGSEVGDVGRGLRAVAWERSAGQFVQLGLGLIVLLLLPSRVPTWLPLVVAAVLVGALGGGLLLSGRPPRGASRAARAFRAAASDIRDGLLARRVGPGIALASVVVVAGHVATLLLAARTAGAISPILQLLPLAVLVLLATAVPTNIGGWGPREGVAAWAFGAAGLGAAQGVATTTVYGRPLARGHLAGGSAARRRLAARRGAGSLASATLGDLVPAGPGGRG